MKNNVAKKYFSKNQFKDATKMSDDKSYVLEILNESTLPHYSFHKLHDLSYPFCCLATQMWKI